MAPIFTPDRQAFREAVAAIAEKARATLPECNGRVEKAVCLVLNGDVELWPDGTAQVYSQSNGVTSYAVVNGHCDCSDSPRAPHGFCKHRLGVAIAKRVQALLPSAPEPTPAPPPPSPPVEPGEPVCHPGEPVAQTPPLGEAPCSVNCHVSIGGRQVQVTLRGTDEGEVLTRLEAVLQRYPQPQAPTSHGEGFCAKHGVQMQQTTKEGRSWWSHRYEGRWCKGK